MSKEGAVWLALIEAMEDGEEPTVEEVASTTGLSESAVGRAVLALLKKELIEMDDSYITSVKYSDKFKI